MDRNRETISLTTDRTEAAGPGRSGERSQQATSLRRTGNADVRPGGSFPRDEKRHAGHGESPAQAERTSRTERASRGHRSAAADRPRRILVVDDSPPYRLALRTVLENMDGVQVVGEVASGEQAVATYRELEPDLVFMDINLPGMDGIETTRRLKRDAPDLVIIGLSVQSDEHTVAAMLRAGAAVHVSKGSGLPEVREVLDRYL